MRKGTDKTAKDISRRDFMKASAAVGAAAMFSGREKLFAQGTDKLRIGLIGCGGRGTGAAKDCVRSSENVEIVAMGDLFRNRLEGSLEDLKNEVGELLWITSPT